MQLGTRWSVGTPAPSNLPPTVLEAVETVEATLAAVDTSQWRWTLTWLESNPVVALDDGTVIRYSGGEAFIMNEDDAEPLH
jgi:hypothetical protein